MAFRKAAHLLFQATQQFALVTDYALTETPTASLGPILGSSVAPGIVLGSGPIYATSYRDEAKDVDAYKIRQFLQPKVVLQNALTMMCT